MPWSDSLLELSCLLLAVEWGDDFTDVARRQTSLNLELAEDRDWTKALTWSLCEATYARRSPADSRAVRKLVVNLAHHNSGVRLWMLYLGWICRQWLPSVEAISALLTNLAEALIGQEEAVALARELSGNDEEFSRLASEFRPKEMFAKQYSRRLDEAKRSGFTWGFAALRSMESECRQMLEAEVLGLRLASTDHGPGDRAPR
ncbi:MAG TPA: hypothetical protein VMT87_05500 [Vicinamibacteria bacterium]|nr:hypothetical protein [Vicinamibacteria bacterium]